jgi:hypothetical protein
MQGATRVFTDSPRNNSENFRNYSLRARIYRFYTRKVYPKIDDKRGATRLVHFLRDMAMRNVPGVESEPTGILMWKKIGRIY